MDYSVFNNEKGDIAMKKLLTLALAIVVVTVFTGLGAAQDTKAQQRSQAKGAETKQPASGEKRVDKASPPADESQGLGGQSEGPRPSPSWSKARPNPSTPRI
jgi:hypothetical protein